MDALMAYLLIINAIAFLFMLVDKRKAQKNAWRIPEATLLTLAILGGSFGAVLGMRIFRHKTRKPQFSLGLPVILVLHILLLVWLVIAQH